VQGRIPNARQSSIAFERGPHRQRNALCEQELGNLLPFEVPFATMLTMVEVDRDDPGFANPTKFIGPVYSETDAAQLKVDLARIPVTAPVRTTDGSAVNPLSPMDLIADAQRRMADEQLLRTHQRTAHGRLASAAGRPGVRDARRLEQRTSGPRPRTDMSLVEYAESLRSGLTSARSASTPTFT
jgi:hypothetical protein